MLTLLSAAAWAAETPSESGGDSLPTILFLLVLVGCATLLARFVLERLQRRFLFVSGIEYVALGVVLGPTVIPQVHPFQNLTGLGPVFAFAAGWVGLLYGLELKFSGFERMGRPLRLALTDGVVTGVFVTLGAYAFFKSGLAIVPPSEVECWLGASVLGCTATAGSSSSVDLLARRYADTETHLLPMLRRTAKLGDALAIVVFGVLMAAFHTGVTRVADPSTSDWVMWTVGLGFATAAFFFFFIGKDEGENNVFLAMVGILLFASGAAFFLQLSALTVNLVLGTVLTQTAVGSRIAKQLARTERPVSIMLLVFAGALWNPVDPIVAITLILGFVGARLVSKVLAVGLATMGTPLRADLFRGMFAQGDAAVAMAISLRLLHDGPIIDLVYTTIIGAVALHELVSTRLLRGLLVDAGELQQDVAMAGK